MRWQYLLSLFLLSLASSLFFTLALFHTDTVAYYPDGDFDSKPTVGYSWILYHFEHWGICLVLNLAALGFFFYGLLVDYREYGWKLSKQTKLK